MDDSYEDEEEEHDDGDDDDESGDRDCIHTASVVFQQGFKHFISIDERVLDI